MKAKISLAGLTLLLASCGAEAAPVVDAASQVTTTQVTIPAVTTTIHVDDSMADDMDDDHIDDDHMDDAITDDHLEGDDHAIDEHADDMPDLDHTTMSVDLADEGAVADRTIEVIMTEFAFEPGPIEVTAGETVKFVVVNEGAIQHEFRVTTQEDIDHHVDEGHTDHSDAIEPGVMLLDPGQSGSMLVTFHEAGEFDMIACLIPTHFEAGMGIELNIKG